MSTTPSNGGRIRSGAVPADDLVIADDEIEAEADPVLAPAAPEVAPGDGTIPPGVPVAVALLRSLGLFTVVFTAVLAATVVAAATRHPTYTAEARLLVGRVDTEARAVPGYTQAAQDLASVYARVATTDPVVLPVAEQSGLPPSEVRRALSASPIPQSAIVRIEASDPSSARARTIADLATRSLAAYVHVLNTVDPATIPEAATYDTASTDYATALVAESDAQKALEQLIAPGSPLAFVQGDQLLPVVDAARLQLIAAKSTTLRKKLLLDAAASTYTNAVRGSGDRNDLSPLGNAAVTGNDRATSLEIGVLAGLVGATILALGVVTARANWPRWRALRRSGGWDRAG